MIRFLLISLFSLLLFSCKPYQIQNAVTKGNTIKDFNNPYFENPDTDYVYKAHIEVYGNKLGGIFVAKRINDTIHRVVFTTEFGNKLMDFELSDTEFKVNYIVEELDRKIIVNTLKDDFRLLLKVKHIISETLENDTSVIQKTANKNTTNYFFFDKKSQKLLKLINAAKTKEKVVFEFESKNATFAEVIRINHRNIKLKIELNQIIN